MTAQTVDYGDSKLRAAITWLGLGEHDAAFPHTWWRRLLVPFRWNSMLQAENATQAAAPVLGTQYR